MLNKDDKGEPLGVEQNIFWNSIGSFIYLFTQWLITVLIARILGFEDAGIFSLAITLTNSLYCIALYGIRNYQVSDIKGKYSDKVYIMARIGTCTLSGLVCIILVGINTYMYYEKVCIIVYMLFRISEAFVDVYYGIFQKYSRMDIVGKSLIYRGIITFLVFTTTILITKNLLCSILIMVIASYSVVMIYDNRLIKREINIKGQATVEDIKRLLVECFPLVIYLFLSTTISTAPRYFLERELGSEVLGIYASIAMPTIIIQVIATYIFTPLITIFAKFIIAEDIPKFRKLFKKVILTITFLAIIAIVGANLLGSWGLKILFGENILIHSYLLMPVIWCSILTAVAWFIGAILTVIGDFKALIISSSVALGVCVLCSGKVINYFGANGTSFILIFCLMIQSIIMCFGENFRKIFLGRNIYGRKK